MNLPEIIHKIIKFITRDRVNAISNLITLSHINSHIRSIISSTPTFWNNLNIHSCYHQTRILLKSQLIIKNLQFGFIDILINSTDPKVILEILLKCTNLRKLKCFFYPSQYNMQFIESSLRKQKNTLNLELFDVTSPVDLKSWLSNHQVVEPYKSFRNFFTTITRPSFRMFPEICTCNEYYVENYTRQEWPNIPKNFYCGSCKIQIDSVCLNCSSSVMIFCQCNNPECLLVSCNNCRILSDCDLCGLWYDDECKNEKRICKCCDCGRRSCTCCIDGWVFCKDCDECFCDVCHDGLTEN